MKYLSAIVVAAGESLRFRSRTPKLLAKINSRPVIFYSLKTLSSHPQVKEIILVVNKKIKERALRIRTAYGLTKIKMIVEGGPRRQDSVRNGMSAVNKEADMLLVHDAARPLVDKDTISAVIKEAAKTGAAIAGVPVKATIKQVTSRCIVRKTLDRRKLYEIQTPQVFEKNILAEAYKRFGRYNVTDESMLAEKLGVPVTVVMGSYNNIKITTPEDLIIAQAIVERILK